MANWSDVMHYADDYGAVGDGVTNDNTAIQDAINDALASGRRIVQLRPGATYHATSLPGYQQIQFLGIGSKFTRGVYRVNDLRMSGKLTLPAAFSWFQDEVHLQPDGTGGTTFDVAAHKPTGGTRYYVRCTGGDDTDDGLTFATGFASIMAALAKPDVGEVVLEPGVYDRFRAVWGLITLPRPVAITVLGGGRAAILGSDARTSWTPDTTYPNVWRRTRTNLAGIEPVWDAKYVDERGDWLCYGPAKATVADVSDTPGSWCYDSGQVCVRTIDDREPDADLHVFLDTSCLIRGPHTIWIQNVDFLGVANVGPICYDSEEVPTWYGWGCKHKYSQSTGGFRNRGGVSYMVDCEFARNRGDGATYSQFGGSKPKGFELRCTGRHNGRTGLGNNQGSTMHDGGSVLRINGEYFENEGPGLEDVHEGTTSYNVGCHAYHSRKATESRNYNSGDGTTMWLVACKSDGVRVYDAITSGTGKLYTYLTDVLTYAGVPEQRQQFNPFL